jgi:hypothetical protein
VAFSKINHVAVVSENDAQLSTFLVVFGMCTLLRLANDVVETQVTRPK